MAVNLDVVLNAALEAGSNNTSKDVVISSSAPASASTNGNSDNCAAVDYPTGGSDVVEDIASGEWRATLSVRSSTSGQAFCSNVTEYAASFHAIVREHIKICLNTLK